MSDYNERSSRADRTGWMLGLRMTGLGLSMLSASFKLYSCVTADGSGEGNEFDIRGQVVDVDEDNITVEVLRRTETQSKSQGILVVGQAVELSADYQDGDCDSHTIGHVEDGAGETISAESLVVGSYVEARGSIRDEPKPCTAGGAGVTHLPVYEVVTAVPG